ncbi:MAG: hypothetical protein JXQ29_18325 [Planctomycetes bacterium]|nr:hypothetical protein [Planctomycetota bacterium]
MRPALPVAVAVGVLVLGAGVAVFRDGTARLEHRATERRLAERVERFWKLKTRGEWAQVHRELLAPGMRQEESADEYARARGIIQYLAWTVDSVKIRGTHARVSLTIEVTIDHARGRALKPSPYIRCAVAEDWVLVDGQWYYEGTVPPAGR